MVYLRVSTLHRLLLIIFIIAVVIAVLVTGLTYFAVQSGIRQLEETVAGDNADRLQLAVRAESESVRQTAFEWAEWDETRAFLDEKNPGFIQKNLDSRFMSGAGITWLLFYNSTGFLRYGAGLDEKDRFIRVDNGDLGQSLLSDQLIRSSGSVISRAGLYQYGDHYLLLAVHPVITAGENGRDLGSVVAVRKLDENGLSTLAASVPGTVRLMPAIPGGNGGNGMFSPGQPGAVYDDNTGIITAHVILPDILERPALSATMEIPFRVPYGMQMILLLLGIILIGFGIFIIAIYYVFTRLFLRYISEIGHELDKAAISGFHDPSFPGDLPLDIVPLASSASRVIHSLDEKQTSVIRSEHARKSVEIRWEILFRSAAEAILIGDEEGVLTCNPRFESLAGVKCEDLVGIPVADLPFQSMVGDGIFTLEDIWTSQDAGSDQFTWKITPGSDGTGSSHLLDTNLRFVEMNGRMLRFLICRDITNEDRLRLEQEQAINQIDENLGQLAALNDEIRNPLTMIAAWAELDNSPNRDKIMEGVQRINAIIDRVDKGYVTSEKVRKYLQKSIDRYQKGPVRP